MAGLPPAVPPGLHGLDVPVQGGKPTGGERRLQSNALPQSFLVYTFVPKVRGRHAQASKVLVHGMVSLGQVHKLELDKIRDDKVQKQMEDQLQAQAVAREASAVVWTIASAKATPGGPRTFAASDGNWKP
eukprot:11799538-Heterocapsa_arctica.AAC.1